MRAIWDLVDGGQLILHRGVRIVDRLLLLNPHIRLLNRLFNFVHIWGALVFILDLSFRKCLFALNYFVIYAVNIGFEDFIDSCKVCEGHEPEPSRLVVSVHDNYAILNLAKLLEMFR